jgi:hypothetical protein
MRWYWKIVVKFAEWLQSEHKFVHVHDLPDHVNNKTIYIVGEKEHPWLLAFNCPCGCQNVIQLNLLQDANPCWKYKVTKKNKINISPSVWRTTGCKSHFFVCKSKIDWVRNYESQKFKIQKHF